MYEITLYLVLMVCLWCLLTIVSSYSHTGLVWWFYLESKSPVSVKALVGTFNQEEIL